MGLAYAYLHFPDRNILSPPTSPLPSLPPFSGGISHHLHCRDQERSRFAFFWRRYWPMRYRRQILRCDIWFFRYILCFNSSCLFLYISICSLLFVIHFCISESCSICAWRFNCITTIFWFVFVFKSKKHVSKIAWEFYFGLLASGHWVRTFFWMGSLTFSP